jgi:hypothetical protein
VIATRPAGVHVRAEKRHDRPRAGQKDTVELAGFPNVVQGPQAEVDFQHTRVVGLIDGASLLQRLDVVEAVLAKAESCEVSSILRAGL